MIDETEEKYWFPAKRFGWGWGPPNNWQGWLVLLGYIVSASLVGVVLSPQRYPTLFLVGIGVLTGVLIVICYLKGEPPNWRWGGGSDLP